ncbi:MAG: branched-chain amino acid ABC transporter permease [Gammaproteobacteria bacterium]|nr:branched-chain amino acid ABC transporter permease [Gammaproteobacteria bacterium]
MDWVLLAEQCLNGFQLGVLLFLLAAGLTLTFGIMDFVNLAHGTFYMLGAFICATFTVWLESYALAIVLGLPCVCAIGMLVERVALRTLYQRDHLDQVLATFGLILFFNELVQVVWPLDGMTIALPAALSRPVPLFLGIEYSSFRLTIIAAGLGVAAVLWFLVARTRVGMQVRAGASNRAMAGALGINIALLFTVVFGIGAMLAGLAGMLMAPILGANSGMGEQIIILTFVVIVVGGIGSIRGAFVAALLIGLIDTLGRAFLDVLLLAVLSANAAEAAGPALSSMLIYIFMVAVLFLRPQGLFAARGAAP